METVEDKIADVLAKSKVSLEIVKICMVPKTVSEIGKELRMIFKGQSIDSHTLGSFLRSLEKAKALKFDEGKWKATDEAKRVIAKYWL